MGMNNSTLICQGCRQDFCERGCWRRVRNSDAITVRGLGSAAGGLGASRGLWPHVLGMTGSASCLFWFLFSLSYLILSSSPLSFFFSGGAAAPSALLPTPVDVLNDITPVWKRHHFLHSQKIQDGDQQPSWIGICTIVYLLLLIK